MDLPALPLHDPPAPNAPPDPHNSDEMIDSLDEVLPCAVTVAILYPLFTAYNSGFVIVAEEDYTLVFTKAVENNKGVDTQFQMAYVYFHVDMNMGGEVHVDQDRREAELLCFNDDFMVFVVKKDHLQRKAITFGAIPSAQVSEVAQYAMVYTIGTISGTKLTTKAVGPHEDFLGGLGMYEGKVNTPNCTSWELRSREIADGTQNYFKFSCSFKDELVTVENIDDPAEDHTSKSILGAPIVMLDGSMVGVVYCVSSYFDDKYGLHTEALISQIERMCKLELMGDYDPQWDYKDFLKAVYQKQNPKMNPQWDYKAVYQKQNPNVGASTS